MDSGTYNFEKMIKHIEKITFGMKYQSEQSSWFNKFGILHDELNKQSGGWTQKVGQEGGNQLLNLFDFANENNGQGLFVSTSRVGFSLNNLDLRKTDVHQIMLINASKLNDLYKILFNVIDGFTFSRFGVYFEFLFSENDIQDLSKLNLFSWLLGKYKINNFEEIDQRFSYIIEPNQKNNYHKMILQFRKVKDQREDGNKEIKYLLTTDFQKFIDPIKIRTAEELENFISEQFRSNYDLFKSHFSELTFVKENS